MIVAEVYGIGKSDKLEGAMSAYAKHVPGGFGGGEGGLGGGFGGGEGGLGGGFGGGEGGLAEYDISNSADSCSVEHFENCDISHAGVFGVTGVFGVIGVVGADVFFINDGITSGYIGDNKRLSLACSPSCDAGWYGV